MLYVDARNIKLIDGPEGAPPDPKEIRAAKRKKEKERKVCSVFTSGPNDLSNS